MTSRSLPQLVLVEDVGADGSPFAAVGYLPSSDRVCVLPSPDGDEQSLTADILRAIGKRGRRPRFRPRSSANPSLRTWLLAEGIAEILVGAGDHLTTEQLDLLDETSHDCRVWLLFEAKVPAFVANRWSQLETAIVKPQSASRFQREEPDAENPDWTDFPALPLHREILFRGRCKRLFDDFEMTRIDRALCAGADHARGLLRRGSASAEEVAEPGLDPTIPIWPALALFRGCQLGALSSGHVLHFHVRRWLQARRAIGEFDEISVAALREPLNPTPGALAVLHLSTAAPVATLVGLSISALNKDASTVRVRDSVYAVSHSVRSPLRAQKLLSEEAGKLALFPGEETETLDQLRAQSMLVSELRRLGLPSATESVVGGSGRKKRDTYLSPRIELELRKLPHAASR